MKISSSKSEAMVLDWKKVPCPLQVEESPASSGGVQVSQGLVHSDEGWNGEKLSHTGGTRSRAAAPPHGEGPAEVARASVPMPPGQSLPGEVFRACPTGRRPRGRPRTRWRDYVSGLSWERLGILPEELEEVCVDREELEEVCVDREELEEVCVDREELEEVCVDREELEEVCVDREELEEVCVDREELEEVCVDRKSWRGVCGQRSLGVLAQIAAPATRPRIKRKKMKWMDGNAHLMRKV
ncbi:hypothetical protein WMY93_025543 [Mugilogobius chulae]|uniref:Uncharacterized protein n=1 Tax=Mugilogobius chulae TaxID=88201 RepID=A0AAW0N1N7_9GOBI